MNNKISMNVNISHVSVKTDRGSNKLLGDYKGQVLLIVNVASKCGFTKQYAELQKLQSKYSNQGFQVLGFPCNDFGGQEPGTVEEIKEFCKLNYQVSFPLFEKIHAKGNTTEPYSTLNQYEAKGDVEWNFEKYLIDKKGNVIGRFKSSVEPESIDIIKAIETALKS